MCFVNYLMKTLQKITNADITQITKVGAHVITSGWGNRYLTVVNNVISEYHGSVNKTELIKMHMLFLTKYKITTIQTK